MQMPPLPSPSSRLSVISSNVDALDRRGILRLRPRPNLVVCPPGFVDVRQTEKFFSRESSIVVISEANWGEIFVKQESPVSCAIVTAQNHLKMLADMRRRRSASASSGGSNGNDTNSNNEDAVTLEEAFTDFAGKSEKAAIESILRVVPSFSRSGLTLDQLKRHVFVGANYEMIRNGEGENENKFSVAEFRDIVKEQIGRFGSIIVGYDMSTLGQIPAGGHFSLVAGMARIEELQAESEETESEGVADSDAWFVLLLDCWPETPVAWVPIETLFRALNTPDRDNENKFRGILRRTS